MSPHRQLLQDWHQQLRALIPGVRRTTLAPLALLSLGLIWAGTVSLPRIAASLPLSAHVPSTARRLARWLANAKVPVTAVWRPFVRAALASRVGTALTLTLDPTVLRDHACIYVLGLVCHKRVLPLIWHLLPNTAPWHRSEAAYLARLFRVVAGWLPPDCTVTLVADRGLTNGTLLRLCQQVGWHYVVRVSTDAKQGPKLPDGRTLWSLVPGKGKRWYGPARLFKQAGWLTVGVSISWRRGEKEPWVLVSDLPAGPARVHTYRLRAHCEATYEDCKTRGWQLEATKITRYDRLNRLLVAVSVAIWWTQQLGRQVIRRGERRHWDRLHRREWSVQRLGREWMRGRLMEGKPPPLPFRWRHGEWRFAWLW